MPAVINIKLNGKPTELKEGMTVADILRERNIRQEMVTVQLNGEVLGREQYESAQLKPGDEVEFLYYMGGGDRRCR